MFTVKTSPILMKSKIKSTVNFSLGTDFLNDINKCRGIIFSQQTFQPWSIYCLATIAAIENCWNKSNMPFEVANRQIKITQEEIMAELQHSLQHNNVIGISLKDTHELLTTAVTEIKESKDVGDFVISLMTE